jgi:CDP-diglyceride synthetase
MDVLEKLKKHSVLFGLVTGAGLALLERDAIVKTDAFVGLSVQNGLFLVVAGFVAPQVVAWMNSRSGEKGALQFFERMNIYISLYAFIVAFAIVTGSFGLYGLNAAGINDGRQWVCGFFLAAALSLAVAYFFDRRLGKNSRKHE